MKRLRHIISLSILIICLLWASWASTGFVISTSNVKPPQWYCDPGVIAQNAARMGLPTKIAGLWVWPGGNWPDVSGNRNDGIFVGGVTRQGDFITLNGSSGFVDVNALDGFAYGDSAVSMCIEVSFTTSQNNRGLIGTWWNADCIISIVNNAIRFRITTPGGNVFALSPGTYNDGKKHFIVGVYDGSFVHLYIDGIRVVSPQAQTGSIITSDKFNIGAVNDASYFFEGNVYSAGVFKNYALNSSQVATIFADPYGLVRQPRRIALWHAGTGAPPPTVMAPYYYMNN